MMAALKCGDGIEHGDVGHVGGVVLEQEIQTRQVGVEFRQAIGVMRMSPGQLGFERDLGVVIPDGVRNEQVDALGVLLHRHGVDLVPGKVAHGAVGFGHHQRFVPIVSGGADDLVEAFRRAVAADLVDPGNVEVLEALHQVARDRHGVDDFFLVLVAGGGDAVGFGTNPGCAW